MPDKPIQFQARPEIPFVTNIQVSVSEEFAIFNIFSGNQVYRFALTPEHAKRVLLLLEKEIGKFEVKHGEIKTSLPEAQEQGKEGTSIGFQAQK
jgi:hypothetical protein